MKKLAVLFLLGGGGYLIYKSWSSAGRGISDSADAGGVAGGLMNVAYALGDELGSVMSGGINGLMNISAQGLTFMKEREGFKAMPYFATPAEQEDGILTIGYGQTYRTADLVTSAKYSKGISKEDAEKLLIERVAQDVKAIKSGVKVKLTQNQFDALVSLRYNVGSLAGSRLIEKLNAGDYIGASEEIMGWVYQKGKFVNGLYKRRAAEQQMFVNGVYNLIWG